MISLAPLQSDQHVDLVNLAQVGCRSFPQRVVELRSDSVMRLLDQLEESFRWPIMVANIPHLPMTAQHEELSLTKVLEIAKQETDKKEAIYRAIATIREGQFVCPNVQACLQQMDSTERLLFFAAIPKDAADIAASMLSQDQITASIPDSSGRVASPQVGVLTLLAIIDKTHAQQAISAMPDSYVEALAAQLPLKNDRMIDLSDLIKYAQNSKAAYRKVVNNRDKTENW